MQAALEASRTVCETADNIDACLAKRLRQLRMQRGLTLRTLAQRSGLAINTLSSIENGKTSPSVSTLQRLAGCLEVALRDLFENPQEAVRVAHVSAGQRHGVWVKDNLLEHLAPALAENALQPLVLTLQPGADSGTLPIVHSGYELIYCLEGSLRYFIEGKPYLLHAGDSLVFESYLPHRWENPSALPARFLLVMTPGDPRDSPAERHFIQLYHKENPMKLAFITDDGSTISRHFGRARFYKVVTIEDGKVTATEMRDKLGHQHFAAEEAHGHEHEHGHGQQHGFDPASQSRHQRMAAAIHDCQMLIGGGMGMGAYQSLQTLNIKPILTDLTSIDEAVQAYLNGTLVDRSEQLVH